MGDGVTFTLAQMEELHKNSSECQKAYADAIKKGDMAYKYPSFCQQIKKDPEELIKEGIKALCLKYSLG